MIQRPAGAAARKRGCAKSPVGIAIPTGLLAPARRRQKPRGDSYPHRAFGAAALARRRAGGTLNHKIKVLFFFLVGAGGVGEGKTPYPSVG